MSELQGCPFCGEMPKKFINNIFCEYGHTNATIKIECNCGCTRTGISFANGKVGSTLSVEDFISALYEADRTAVDKWNIRY